MRFFLEVMSVLALAAGFTGAVAADVYCWTEAGKDMPAAGSFAIAGAILTGMLALSLAVYMRPGSKGGAE